MDPNIGCPAYAGMDPKIGSAQITHSGLPRLRGDGPPASKPRWREPWAAPPTRGWTQDRVEAVLFCCGCPAYAGMDPRQR